MLIYRIPEFLVITFTTFRDKSREDATLDLNEDNGTYKKYQV